MAAPSPGTTISSAERQQRRGQRLVIALPYLFLLLFFSLPFLVVLHISVSDMDGIRFVNLTSWVDGVLTLKIKLSNYIFLTSDSLYIETYWSSIKFAALNTVLCLIIGYPFAYFMARSPSAWRPALLMGVSLPFWTSYLLRIYAWRGLLDEQGIVNAALMALGLVHSPVHMMYTPFSMTIGMVYTYVPFMILPLYSNLVKMDLRLLEAANDLGATPWKAFWLITVPLSKSGIIAGSMLVFIPSLGEYVIPELLGGPSTLMIGRVLWDEFFSNNDWPMASAVAVSMVVLILIPLVVFNRYQNEAEVSGRDARA
ncbi:MAG: ABC transporter permease subunit [Burkholderiales bacterium]|nr:ABC transporter permease subunit [Burkholderiales bacterium]MDE2394763.1 ABC transporter permease subunit [Burkholderiales bacterium]MDE2456591.1 ABC transporter permease subunit [Burkholderiales bacterium]